MLKKLIGLCAVLVLAHLVLNVAYAEGVVLPEHNYKLDVMEKYILAVDNYTYVLDEEGTDVWTVYDGRVKFTGDCEDFAFTMQRMVGAGSVYPVSPTRETVFYKKAYKSVLNIPKPVDLAVIVIKNTLVANVLEECGKKKMSQTTVDALAELSSGTLSLSMMRVRSDQLKECSGLILRRCKRLLQNRCTSSTSARPCRLPMHNS